MDKRQFILATTAALALAAVRQSAAAQAVDVQHTVAPIDQSKGNLCWAAATAMLLNWKFPGLNTMLSVAQKGGADYLALYNNAINDATPSEISAVQEANLYKKLSLVVVTGVNPTVNGWRQLLMSKGPLHVTIKPNGSGGMLHGVLLTGLVGDGSADKTDVLFNDPAGGKKSKMPLSQFVTLYGGAANWTNNIIHNP